MIAGLLSQGMQAVEAAKLAAYFHGSLADYLIANGNDQFSLMARDLISLLAKVIKNIRGTSKIKK